MWKKIKISIFLTPWAPVGAKNKLLDDEAFVKNKYRACAELTN